MTTWLRWAEALGIYWPNPAPCLIVGHGILGPDIAHGPRAEAKSNHWGFDWVRNGLTRPVSTSSLGWPGGWVIKKRDKCLRQLMEHRHASGSDGVDLETMDGSIWA